MSFVVVVFVGAVFLGTALFAAVFFAAVFLDVVSPKRPSWSPAWSRRAAAGALTWAVTERKREIRVADAAGIDFPHAAQIFQITRRSKKPDASPWQRKEIVFGITALTPDQAGPADLAGYTRGHRSVENKSHYVRDVTFREDAGQTRTGHAPANLATLRNLVIATFRHAGHTNIAHARTLQSNDYHRALTLFAL